MNLGEVTVTGFAEFAKAMDNLTAKVNKSLSVRAMKRALKPTKAELSREAPEDTGAMLESFKIRVLRDKDKHTKRVGLITAGKWFTGETFYAAFVEFEHRVGPRKLGDARTLVPGEHFLENSFDETRDEVIKQLEFHIWNEIEKEIKKGTNGASS